MARSPLRRGLPRPTPQRPLAALAVVLLMACCLIPSVSATILYDEYFEDYNFTGGKTVTVSQTSGGGAILTNFIVSDISRLQDLQYIALEFDKYSTISGITEGRNELTYTTSFDPTPKPMVVDCTYFRDLLGNVIHSRFIFYYPDWDVGDAVGEATISIPSTQTAYGALLSQTGDSPVKINVNAQGTTTITVASGIMFKNHLLVSDDKINNILNLKLTRIIDGTPSASTLTVYDGNDTVYNDYSGRNIDEIFLLDRTSLITLMSGDKIYSFPIGTGMPGTSTPVTVYVRNSQTGSLLANAHIVINASVNGTLHEVVNESLPSGTYSVNLQPTGGGLPNPDFYRLTATADGYNPYMPYIDFELDRPTTLIVEMEPTGGGPEDENKTFIEFYVRDLNTNPISGATVTCGGYSLLTNSAGFTQFELPVNASYPYTVSKSNYITIEGTATVADDPRYTANVVLGQGEIPTLTPTQTEPGATPTPDRRTNEEKGQSAINMIADFAELIVALALIGTVLGILKLWGK